MPASPSDESPRLREDASPLVVEDGTRLVGANTYAGLATADAYHRSRNTPEWPCDSVATASVDDPAIGSAADIQRRKCAALVRATDWLNSRIRWAGRRLEWQQLMAWPRTGVLLPEGPVPDNQVPPQVVDACCELAGHFMTADPLAPLERGGQVISETVDCLSVTYAAAAPVDILYPKVSGLLAGLGTAEEPRAGSVEVGRG